MSPVPQGKFIYKAEPLQPEGFPENARPLPRMQSGFSDRARILHRRFMDQFSDRHFYHDVIVNIITGFCKNEA